MKDFSFKLQTASPYINLIFLGTDLKKKISEKI